MTQKPDNPQAFPCQGTADGMTLRDYFAEAALEGMMPNSNEGFRMAWADYAEASYAIADAMLNAREATHD